MTVFVGLWPIPVVPHCLIALMPHCLSSIAPPNKKCQTLVTRIERLACRTAAVFFRPNYRATTSTGSDTIEILFVCLSVTLIRNVYFPIASVSGSDNFLTR